MPNHENRTSRKIEERIRELPAGGFPEAESAKRARQRLAVAMGLPVAPADPPGELAAINDTLAEVRQAFGGGGIDAARAVLADALGLPQLESLDKWANKPEPSAVLRRDRGGQFADAVLSVGEVCILSGAGGIGKSTLALQWAVAAAEASAAGDPYGEAAGVRVRAGPVLIVNYEDAPARMARRAKDIAGGAIPSGLTIWQEPEPLFVADPENRGQAKQGAQWAALWDEVRKLAPSLVIVDPASVALSGASGSEQMPVRAFMLALGREAQAAGCGVLLIAHDTKLTRDAGGAVGAGAVAGSAAWWDAARGVLHLRKEREPAPAPKTKGGQGQGQAAPPKTKGEPYIRELEAAKANYGKPWELKLEEIGGTSWQGFQLAPPDPDTVSHRPGGAAASGRDPEAEGVQFD